MVVNMNTPAFPDQYKDGMTLRDYFAAKAMQGFAAYIGPSMTFDSRAKTAYEWADAMLKAREAWTHKN